MITSYLRTLANNGISAIKQNKSSLRTTKQLPKDTFIHSEETEETKYNNLISAGIDKELAKNIAKMGNDKYQKALELSKKKVYSEEIAIFINLPDDKYTKIINFLNKGHSPSTSMALASLEGEEEKRAIYLLSKGIYGSMAVQFAKIPDVYYMRVLKLIDKQINPMHFNSLITLDDSQLEKIMQLMERGINIGDAKDIIKLSTDEYKKAIFLLYNGIIKNVARIAQSPSLFQKATQGINSPKYQAVSFYYKNDYNDKLKKYSQGKYQNEIMDLLSSGNISFKTINNLIGHNISEQDYFYAVQMLSKSTFKLAMDKPNQYLSAIDKQYSTKVEGKYPQLPEDEQKREQQEIKKFFKNHITELIRAYKYLDSDTINQIMDKRTDKFEEYLNNLNELNENNYTLLSKLIRCKSQQTNKDLTSKAKIQLCQIVEIFQKCDIDITPLQEMAEAGKVDICLPKQIINRAILEKAGISEKDLAQIPDDKIKLNEEFSYLTLMKTEKPSISVNVNTTEILEALARGEDVDTSSLLEGETVSESIVEELYTVIKASLLNDFKSFITDKSNKYGLANAETKNQFKKSGLNYDKWINPNLEDLSFEIDGKKMTIKLWERNPQEDLFMGNETTCCTAIGTGHNAAATPIFLLNTAFNVIDLYDENGNLVGLSRVFMTESDGKPAMIMDNLEMNNTFAKNIDRNENLKTIRNQFFKYIKQYAKQVTGEQNPQILMSPQDTKVPTDDLQIQKKKISFIGAIAQNMAYFNSIGLSWFRPETIAQHEEISWNLVS